MAGLRFLSIIMAVCLCAACVTGGGLLPTSRPAAPEWTRMPPADTAEALYGIGEGPDLDSARRAALRDVAAKLRVSISGTVDSQVTVANDAADRVSRTRISEEVRKTTFGKHRLERSEDAGGGVYALVSVDRALLVSETRHRLDEAHRAVRHALAAQRGTSGLDRLRFAGQARAHADDGSDLLSLLASASPGTGRDVYVRDFEAARRSYDEARSGLSFRLQYRPADEDVAALLRQLMSEAELRLQDAGAASAVLVVGVDVKDQSLYGNIVSRVAVGLSLRSERGAVFAQKDYQAEGSSATDRAMARQAALRKLLLQWRSKGALAAIGLDGPAR